MMTVVVPLSAFLRFMAELFLSSFRAAISLRDKLFLGLLTLILVHQLRGLHGSLKGNKRNLYNLNL